MEDRCDHRHVGQVRAAIIGAVQHEGIAGADLPGGFAHHHLDGMGHGPKMHRHMGRIRHQIALPVKDGTGKIQPFLDVDRPGRIGQRGPHLVGDRHEQIVENLKQHRIGFGSGSRRTLRRKSPLQHKVCQRIHPGRPPGLDNDGPGRLGDHHRAGQHDALHQARAVMQRHGRPAPRPHGQRTGRPRKPRRRMCRVLHAGFADSLGTEHFEQKITLGREEPEPRPVQHLEGGLQGCGRPERYIQRLMGPGIAQMRPAFHGLYRDALRPKVIHGLHRQGIQHRRCLIPVLQRFIKLAFMNRPRFCQAHSVGGQHPGKGMQKHPLHSQSIRHARCMLAPGPAKALQGIACHIMPPLHADLLDRIRHIVDRDAQKPVGHLFRTGRGCPGGSGNPGRQGFQPVADNGCIQRQRAIRSEDGRKMCR